jgi:hypothetical protein
MYIGNAMLKVGKRGIEDIKYLSYIEAIIKKDY